MKRESEMSNSQLRDQVLRTLDKADRFDPGAVFDLLTGGRKDASGAFIPGCGLDNSQALLLTGFVFSTNQKHSQIFVRLEMMRLLEEKVIDAETGRTLWDEVLGMLPSPGSVGVVLDQLIEGFNRRTQAAV